MKLFKILLIVIVLFISIGVVSAEGNFTALQDEIDSSTDSIDINQDYIYDNGTDYELNSGILINKSNFSINGNGHTIDGSGQARIFNITGSNISISNLIFINGFSQANGGAIFSKASVNLINCVFENNTAVNGGAVYFSKELTNSTISCTFNGNNASRTGGAIHVRGLATNNEFTSQFNANNAAYGAGMFFYSDSNNNSFNGDFINNIARSCGGAIFFYGKTNYNRFKGSYIHNEAHGAIDEDNGNGGAITFKNTSKNSIFVCDFINNTARLYGGAVNYRMTPYNITFKGNFIANSAQSGGGLNFFNESDNVTFTCNFIANNATNGGAIAVNIEETFGIPIYSTKILTVANCNFTNNNATKGGAIYLDGNVIVKDCNFEYNYAQRGGAVFTSEVIYCENSNFKNNSALSGGAIYSDSANIENSTFSANIAKFGAGVHFLTDAKIEDTKFLNSYNYTYSMIHGTGAGCILVNNCEFLNLTSKYSPAIDVVAKSKVTIKNSLFKDLHALLSGGAIVVKGIMSYVEIENCLFINTTAVNNGGALFLNLDDDLKKSNSEAIVKNNTFINSSANFGGSIVQLGGNLTIIDSRFLENEVEYDGGAIYVSFVNLKVDNAQIFSNRILNDEMYNGGGIYCDKSNVTIKDSLFEENTKNAVYSYGCNLSVENTIFSENTEAIHGVFTTSTLKDNDYGNDTLFLNDTYYLTVIEGNGMKIELINNTINVTDLPSRYDSRDWGWVSSVKNQGENGACWTFGNCGALESALLKETGIEYDLSENNMQNSMLKYSKYGVATVSEGGMYIQGLEYLISWLGTFPSEYDSYDEVGRISPLINTGENIHIQDAIFIEPRKNATDNDALKRAIIECGSLNFNFNYLAFEPIYNTETYAQYQDTSNIVSHAVSVVGWDDNYSASNFRVMPPGDGAFILKNSYGESFGDDGYMYISYYDTSILNEITWGTFGESTSVGYILENQEAYTKVYQRDVGGLLDKYNNYTTFKVNYQSVGNDLISGVGSYFRENEEYSIEIYVNDKLKYTQTGNAPFTGYHTVRLTSEIPIKEGDDFMVLMKKDYVPIIYESTQFYESGSVFVEMNGEWVDMALEDKSATLKVYTKDLAIYTEDLVKIYKNDSNFVARIGVANETVTFEINGVAHNRVTDENGTAIMIIDLSPGNYTIKTTYNNFSVENNIEVLPTLIAENLVKYFRDASQFYISLIDGEGNPVVGKNITMNISGVLYNRVTNGNGTAELDINLNPDEYILTAFDPLTGLQMSYNITVLPLEYHVIKQLVNTGDIHLNDDVYFNITFYNDGDGDITKLYALDKYPNALQFNVTTQLPGWHIENDMWVLDTVFSAHTNLSLILPFKAIKTGNFTNRVVMYANTLDFQNFSDVDVSVSKWNTIIEASDVRCYPGNIDDITVIVLDENGKPVMSGKVVLEVSDKIANVGNAVAGEYVADVVKGKAVFKNVLMSDSGIYEGYLVYFGDESYNLSNNTIKITVLKVPVDIFVKADSGKPGETVLVTVKVIPGDNTTFTGVLSVNLPDGTTKQVTVTNGIGITYWTIPKDFQAGTYDVQSTFDGDDYYLSGNASTTVKVLEDKNADQIHDNGTSKEKPINDSENKIVAKHETGNPILVLIVILTIIGLIPFKRKEN